MTRLLTLVGAAALLATPALANSGAWHSGPRASLNYEATGAYASADAYRGIANPGIANPGYVIQGDHQSLAADPDPAVRLSLQRDNPTSSMQ